MNPGLKHIQCPMCGKSATWQANNPYRPFCSERCRVIDLGEWASENYSIESDEKPGQDSREEEQD